MLANFAADFLSELRISKIPQIMVRVITRGGVGELSDPLVKRTNPSAPGSPPMYLEVTAQVTIQPIKHILSDSKYGIVHPQNIRHGRPTLLISLGDLRHNQMASLTRIR